VSGQYSNLGIYVVLKTGDKWPLGVSPPAPGEGANSGELPDKRKWFKNCFLSPEQMRSVVHAEDAGKLEIKTADEIRTFMSQEVMAVEPL